MLFLLSDESGYITGAEVAIDGGATSVAAQLTRRGWYRPPKA